MQKKFIKILFVLVLILGVVCLVGCGGKEQASTDSDAGQDGSSEQYTAENPLVIRISFLNAPHDSSVRSGRKWAEMLAERSEGRIKLEVYPAGELGGARENFQAVQEGSLEMASLIPGTIAGFDRRLELSSLPGLFIDKDTAQKIDREGFVGQEMDKYYEENGIIRLVKGEPNFYYFFTTEQAGLITSMEEAKGKRLRIPESPMLLEFFEGIGAVPTPMPWGEIYTALQRNALDGTVGNIIWSVAAQFHEVARNISLIPIQYSPSDWLFSKVVWEKIPEDLQNIILETIPDIQEYAEQSWFDEIDSNMEMMRAEGVQIVDISEEEELQWQKQCHEIWRDYAVGVWGEEMVQRLEKEILQLE